MERRDILQNTRPIFDSIVEEYPGDKGRITRRLTALLSRHQMDMRNMMTSQMSDMELEISRLIDTGE